MKCPAETIDKFKIFTENIKNEKWRINFVLTLGYLKFIEDLERCAAQLAAECHLIREKYGDTS